jgi:protein phosphatase
MPTSPAPEVGSRSDPGRQRKGNEDRIFADAPSHPSVVETRGLLFAVADGMGGRQAGGLAADCAITKVKDEYYYGDQSLGITDALRRAVVAANATVYDLGRSHPSRSGMGTTVVVAAVHAGRAVVVNVGDSRAYLANAESIRRITTDHSLVQTLIDSGTISPDEARKHPQGNVITRSLGAGPSVETDAFEVPLQPGETLVLCSDGLSGQVSDDEIWSVVKRLSPRRAADELVRLANDRGGPDNIAVIVVGPPHKQRFRSSQPLRRHLPEVVGLMLLLGAIGAYASARLQAAPIPSPTPTDSAGQLPAELRTSSATSDNPTLGHVDPLPVVIPSPAGPSDDAVTLAASTTPTVTTVATPRITPVRAKSTSGPAVRIATATATSIRSPTATPMVNPVLLLNPAVNVTGAVQLSWSYSGPLTDNEMFDIRVWGNGKGSANAGIANVSTSERTYLIGSGFVYGPGTYNWTIALIRTRGATVETVSVATSPPMQFTWLP